MAIFFDTAYALVIFAALLAAGSIPGFALGLFGRPRDRRLRLAPAYVLAIVGWLWFGVLGGRYGISRLGLAAFCAVGALGFVRGWVLGLQAGRQLRALADRPRASARVRARRSRTPASPR